MIVCIAGISGTGKTEIAHVLQSMLYQGINKHTRIIHIDDYYYSSYLKRDQIRRRTGIIGKAEINWQKLDRIACRFKANSSKLYLQHIHKYLEGIEHVVSPGRKIDILIVEGLYALYLNQIDFGIYLDGEISDTQEFRIRRGKENPSSEFRQTILELERDDVHKSREVADLIIPFKVQ
jgi:uridine kinase